MIVVGIDPGFTGALGYVSDTGEAWVDDLPILQEGKKKSINPYVLANMLWDIQPDLVVIELVGAMPGQGVSSMFNFGYGAGLLYGVCGALQTTVEFVSPTKWKRGVGLLSREKGTSRSLATRTYPKLAPLFQRVKDDGRAEAILIAHWRLNLLTRSVGHVTNLGLQNA